MYCSKLPIFLHKSLLDSTSERGTELSTEMMITLCWISNKTSSVSTDQLLLEMDFQQCAELGREYEFLSQTMYQR